MEIIAVCNRKGGCGKTSTATALVSYLGSVLGKTVVLLDADSQCNASYALGGDLSQSSFYDVLSGTSALVGTGQSVCGGKVVLIPGSDLLANFDNGISEIKIDFKKELKRLANTGTVDYVVIDTAPALGLVTALMLSVADKVIIPVSADVYNIQGMQGINELVGEVNKDAVIAGILLTRFRERYLVNRRLLEMVDTVAGQMGVPVFRTRIREGVVIPEAAMMQQGLFDYDPEVASNAARDYRDFADELLG